MYLIPVTWTNMFKSNRNYNTIVIKCKVFGAALLQ